MKFQSLPSIFVYVLVFIAINALFVLNEQTGFLMDSEFKLIIGDRFGEHPFWVGLSQQIFELTGGQSFIWRLVSMIALVISLLASYNIGKKLFGKDSLQWAMIIMTSSIFLLFYGRFFSLDTIYFVLQLPLALLMIDYIKTPKTKNLLILIPLLLLCFSLDWYRTLVFIFLFGSGIYAFLFQIRKSIKIVYLLFSLSFLVVNYLFVGAGSFNNFFLLQSGTLGLHSYVIILLVGFLPFIGFVLAGIFSLPLQIKRKDEFSIWMFLLLVAGLISFSMIPVFVFSMLIGKHSLAFASERYKYKNLVKTSFLVHLTLILVGGIVTLIWAFIEYRGAGFRAGLGLCSIYWVLAFATVVGLYGGNMKYYLRAPLLAGPLFVLFFWVLVYQLDPNILGPYQPTSMQESEKEVSVYLSDLSLKNNLDYLYSKGKLNNTEVYNGNVNTENLQVPALLDEITFQKIQEDLNEAYSVKKKTFFTGARLKSLYFLEGKE